jgi:PhoPQ-activated pathogenicity-related protein
MPKLQINGTNDPYWTLDSLNIYWNDLIGPSYVVYLPNAVHNLKENRDWATNGIGAFFRHVAIGREMPKFSWTILPSPPKSGERVHFELNIDSPAPKAVRFWFASTKTRDFRESHWGDGGTTFKPAAGKLIAIDREAPDVGHAAIFADLIYEIDGLEYHLSSQIAIYGPREKKP